MKSGHCVLRTNFPSHLVQRPTEGNVTAADGLRFSNELEEKKKYFVFVCAPVFKKKQPIQCISPSLLVRATQKYSGMGFIEAVTAFFYAKSAIHIKIFILDVQNAFCGDRRLMSPRTYVCNTYSTSKIKSTQWYLNRAMQRANTGIH